jgi:UDP-2-acetamido-2,6-beta-L-arabino-hexul-4-ose reductase
MTKERSISGVKVESVGIHQDSRGSLFEPLEAARLASQRNLHVVITEPGCVRGNHYHPQGTEVVTVQGPARVRIRDGQVVQEIVIPDGVVTRFTIPPGIAHAIQNLGTRPMLLIVSSDLVYDPEVPDVVRDILIEA